MLFKGKEVQQERFDRLAEQTFPSVYGTALRLTRNDDEAKDLCQETFLRAYQNFEKFDGRNFKAWILRILTNLYINRYRQRQREVQTSALEDTQMMEPVAPRSSVPDREIFDQLVSKEVEDALEKVPADFRVTIILSDIEGLSYEEIARATDVPIGTVRSRLARGRAILRRELESYARQQGFI
jgi:RNA polymerase sigma-70 factor (ECF subfamily)